MIGAWYRLTEGDVASGIEHGAYRNDRPDWPTYFPTDPDARLAHNIRATLAEIAVHRSLGLRFTDELSVQRHDEPDVPPDWQVRATAVASGHLIVYRDDNPAHRYLLCIVPTIGPLVHIVGHRKGRDCQQETYWRRDAKMPSFWVPQSDLKPWE